MFAKMAKVDLMRKNQDGFLNFIENLKKEARSTFILGRYLPEKGVKLYMAAIGAIMDLLDENEMRAEALEYGVSVLPDLIDLHTIYCSSDRDNISSEVVLNNTSRFLCKLLLNTVCLMPISCNKEAFDSDSFDDFNLLFQLCIKRFRMLKLHYPDSPVVAEYAKILQRVERTEDHSQHYSADLEDLKKMAISLGASLAKRPFYNSEKEAQSRLSKYDNIYAQSYFNRIYDTYVTNGVEDSIDFLTSQYTSMIEVDKIGEDVGKYNIYKTDDFDWSKYPEHVYSCYRRVCEKYQITPMVFDKYRIDEKMPYISFNVINRMTRDVVKTLLHLKDHKIGPLEAISTAPSTEELLNFCETFRIEKCIIEYLLSYLTFMNETDIMMNDFEEIATISILIVLKGEDDLDGWKLKLKEKFMHYNYRLKGIGVLPQDWEMTTF